MATQVQWRGGSTAEHSTFTGAAREVTVDTQKKTLVVHDGSTAGGEPLLREDQANLPSSVTNGISVPSANNVAISTNGTGRIYIDPNGKIGFNQSSPGSFTTGANNFVLSANDNVGMTIASLSSGLSNIYFADGTTGSEPYRGFVSYNHSTDYLQFGTSGTERLRITADGKLGLGTSDPLSFATFNGGNSAGFTDVLQLSAGAASADSGPGLTFNFNYGDYASWKGWQLGAIRAGAQNPAGGYAGYLSFYTNTGGSLTEKLRITADGKLGLGTSNPSHLFSVVGTGGGSFAVNGYANALARINATTNAVGAGAALALTAFATKETSWIIAAEHTSGNNGDLAFYGYPGGTTYAERLRIKSSGIVNIANTPTYADNTAATAGGLVAGDIYRKADGTLMITY